MNFLIVAASDNNNLNLAKSVSEEAAKLGAKAEILDLTTTDLPLYTTKVESEDGIPEKVKELSGQLGKANVLVIVAPEYNGGVPPVLTNYIAWMSRSGDDWRSLFNGKQAIIGTHSGGGGQNVLNMMRVQLAHLGMDVKGRMLLTNFQKPLNPESLTSIVSSIVK